MRILAVGCHPDDIEVSCAGTLARYAREGHTVILCHLCNGNLGHVVIEPEALREIRAREAKAAGALIGAEVLSGDIGDLNLYAEDPAVRSKVVDIIRYACPDIILTHAPEDYMPDHVAVSKLVFAASFAATVPHYTTEHPFHPKITPIYYMDTLAGVGFQPSEYVDITETIEMKLQMLARHESQTKWMKDHDGIDFEEFVRSVARFRGLQSGVKYAEAFRPCMVWPRVGTKRYMP
jgi:LmbE family N-acetylglucosaminyl deacetylase